MVRMDRMKRFEYSARSDVTSAARWEILPILAIHVRSSYAFSSCQGSCRRRCTPCDYKEAGRLRGSVRETPRDLPGKIPIYRRKWRV
jgi:hypothetical protein